METQSFSCCHPVLSSEFKNSLGLIQELQVCGLIEARDELVSSACVCSGLLFTGSLWTLFWFNETAPWCCQAAAGGGMLAPGCCCCLSLCLLFIHSVFVLLRPEPSGDSAALLCTPRSLPGDALPAASVWSQRSAAIGQQRRPHPHRHRCPARTRTPPRAPHTVSA